MYQVNPNNKENIVSLLSNLKVVQNNIKNQIANQSISINDTVVSLMDILKIISNKSDLCEISDIIKNLINEVKNINLSDENINFDAFEYLWQIIYDIDIFLNDYFILCKHNDMIIIRDSLSSNIEFFISELIQDDNSDTGSLDFF